MKEELEKKKKTKKLAEAAGAGGIKSAISENAMEKITGGLKKAAKKVAEANSKTIGSMAKDLIDKKKENKLKSRKDNEVRKSAAQMQKNSEERFEKLTGRKMTGQEWNDAWLENQTAERYSKVGVSPIYSKGNFDRSDKELDEKYGARLTEDDKVPSTSKKRNRVQY